MLDIYWFTRERVDRIDCSLFNLMTSELRIDNRLTWESIKPNYIQKRFGLARTVQPAPLRHHADHLIGGDPIGKFTLRMFFGDFRWLEENLGLKMIGCKIKELFIIGCKEKLYFTMLELGGFSLRSLSWVKTFFEVNVCRLNCLCRLNSILRNRAVRAWGKSVNHQI